MKQPQTFTFRQKTAAWLVHAFTASGIVAGFFALVAISERHFGLAFGLLFVAVIIDGVDGTLARWCKVEEVLPWMSGKTMDYVIDFATYAIIPAYLIYAATQNGVPPEQGGVYLVPDALRGWSATLILLISTLYYGKKGMVSDDLYFIGFPVLWNLVAFYLYYVLALPPIWNFVLILVFSILHFVPLKYVYPSRTEQHQVLNLCMSALLLGSNFVLLLLLEGHHEQPLLLLVMRILSLISLTYFGAFSLYQSYGPPAARQANSSAPAPDPRPS